MVTAASDGAVLLASLGSGPDKQWIDGDFDDDGLVTASRDGGLLLAALATDQAAIDNTDHAYLHDAVFAAAPPRRLGSTWER